MTEKKSYHNCPAHHQFEVNLVNWRLEICQIESTYDDTENVMIYRWTYSTVLFCRWILQTDY